MKNNFLFTALALLFWQCSTNQEPPLTYYEREVKFMQELTPQLAGTWNLQWVNLSAQRHKTHNQNKLQLSKDTVFQDLAILAIKPVANPHSSSRQARYPEFEGTIEFRDKIYPVYFYLIANLPSPATGSDTQVRQAFFLLEYNFPVGTHTPEAEENFLRDMGLINENFSLELTLGRPAMRWKGLNRGIDNIELVKLQ